MAEEDKVVTNDETEQDYVQEESSEDDNKNRALSSKNAMIAGVAVVLAFFCYKIFFATEEVKDVVDTDSIIREKETGTVNAKDNFGDVDSLVGLNNLNNIANGDGVNQTSQNVNQLVPTIPDVDIAKIQVPDLSEDLKIV